MNGVGSKFNYSPHKFYEGDNMSKYKFSNYNIFTEINPNCFSYYNTMYGSLLLMDNEAHEKFQRGCIEHLDCDFLKTLKDSSFVLDEHFEEMNYFSLCRNHIVHNTDLLYIFFTITKNCNSACTYCFQSRNKNTDKNTLTWENAKKVRTFVERSVLSYNCKRLHIDFFGGEPFTCYSVLKNEMIHYSEYAKEHGLDCKFRIYTNGTMLSEKRINFLAQQPISDLQITLDGPKIIHDANRPLGGGKGSYDVIVRNLCKLREKNVPFMLRVNYDLKTADHFEELLRDLKDKGLSGVSLYPYPVQSMTAACNSYKHAVSSNDLMKILPRLLRAAVDEGFVVPLNQKPTYMYCSASRYLSYVIDQNALLFKCALLQDDEKYIVGELNNEGEIINLKPEFYRWFSKNPVEFKKCKKCKLLPVCAGGCSGSATHKYGTYLTNNCYENNIAMFKHKMLLHITSMVGKET